MSFADPHLRDLVSTASEVCAAARQMTAARSQYQSPILHVSDVVGCHAKLFLDRGHDPAGACYQMVKMLQGKLLEAALVARFCGQGMTHEPVYGGRTVGTAPVLAVHATPDFVAPPGGPAALAVEFATVGYPLPQAHFMAMQQARLLGELGPAYAVPLPAVGDPARPGLYPDVPGNFPQYLFLNHLLAAAAQAQASGAPQSRLTLAYTNAEEEYLLEPADLAPYYALFERRVAGAADALARAVVRAGAAPAGAPTRVRWPGRPRKVERRVRVPGPRGGKGYTAIPPAAPGRVVSRGVPAGGLSVPGFLELYYREFCSFGILLASVACPTCPHYLTHVCPGMPPLHSPKAALGDFARLEHFIAYVPCVADKVAARRDLAEVQAARGPARRDRYVQFLKTAIGTVCDEVTCSGVAPALPPARVDWTGLVSPGSCDLSALAGQFPALGAVGQGERATPPP